MSDSAADSSRRRSRCRFILLALAPLAAGGAYFGHELYERRQREHAYEAHRVRHFPKDVTELMGRRTMAILRGATRVDVHRLGTLSTDGKLDAAPSPASDGVATLGAPFAQRIADVLLDDKSYMFEVAKMCIFQPGVRFQFWKGAESVGVNVCFVCNEIAVQNLDAAELRIDDIDPIRRKLLAFARDALPEDLELRTLE